MLLHTKLQPDHCKPPSFAASLPASPASVVPHPFSQNLQGQPTICSWRAVRVINCDGSAQSSAVIAGLDWLAQNYQLPAVASMSLGSDSPNQALDDAVTAIIALGITAVIAAGNYNQGQCRQDFVVTLLFALSSILFAALPADYGCVYLVDAAM